MSLFSSNDQEDTPEVRHYKEISKYLDDKYGFWSYFDIRSVVKSAMDNTLKEDYPNIPYSAADIISWAKWNDKESFLMTPGEQAINGEKTAQELFGAPVVDPLTGKKNSKEKVDGVIVTTLKKTGVNALKIVGVLAAAALAYTYLEVKVKKAGGK